MPISLTGTGLAVIIVQSILHYFGITPDANSISQVVDSTITVGAWIVTIFGQLRRADLSYGLFRK